MYRNFIKETCTGTGDVVTFQGAVEGFLPFSTAAGEVAYVIVDADGISKCAGVSYNFDGSTLERGDTWSFNGTTADTNPSGNIPLSGGVHTIYCAESAEQLNKILYDLQDIEFDISMLDLEVESVSSYLGDVQAEVWDLQEDVSSLEGSVATLALRSRKNSIINGDFDIWQEGTSFVANGYGPDMWIVGLGGGGLASRISTTGGLEAELGSYYLLVRRTTGATSTNVILEQRIEDVRTLAGKEVTLSVICRASVATSKELLVSQVFGTGGSPSANALVYSVAVPFGTEWAKHSFTLTIPPLTGKTLGTNGNSYLRVYFAETTPYQAIDLLFAKVQLEEGSIATEFEQRFISEELLLCQRYYWRGSLEGLGGGFFASNATSAFMYAGGRSFPVPMRATPSISTVAQPTYLNCTFESLLASTSNDGFALRVNPVSLGTPFRAANGIYAADARL